MLTPALVALSLLGAAEPVPTLDRPPVIQEVRSRRRARERRARNVLIAAVLLLNDDYERCLQEYVIHYGAQVHEGCVRDLMNFEGIPLEVRQEWYNWRFNPS